MSNTAEKIGETIGVLIGVGLIVGTLAFGVSACSKIELPTVGSKWMSGKDLADKDADMNSPEGQALIAAFDKDNGTVYCVPKMSGAELGEFRAKIPGLMIGSVFQDAFSGQGLKDFNQDKPLESVLRMTFTKSYPCK